VRVGAAEALAEFRYQETVDALVAALRDRNEDVRLAAAMSLASMRQAPPASKLVEALGIGRSETSLLTVALFEEIAAVRPEEVRALIEDENSPGASKQRPSTRCRRPATIVWSPSSRAWLSARGPTPKNCRATCDHWAISAIPRPPRRSSEVSTPTLPRCGRPPVRLPARSV
jgi:hypothetical protein